ncbi:bifunctional DNA primase/polymerase [Marinactinospora rubrisoli]|uniref:Bifunctional DNA primase/polymerase n=1 Tax=Marinactinospora rubrisoli TaxID=2715399 RepID=A0ABW2K8G2_9ACTN
MLGTDRAPSPEQVAQRASSLLGAALAYAARGWPVLPCEPGGKAPAGALVPHGLKQATTDPKRIREWWRRYPAANVAIATGAPAVDVVDVDNKPDGDGFAAFARLARAGVMVRTLALVRTPSGGFHAYRTGTDQRCGRLAAHFIDFKASGGYVLAPPSTVGGRPYVLVEERAEGTPLDWQQVKRILEPPRRLHVPARRLSRTGTAGLAAWVGAQSEGNRNSALFWAACKAAESGAGPADFEALAQAARGAGLDEHETRATIRSAQRRAGAARE